MIEELLDYEDPLLFKRAIEEVSEKYGINPQVFYAIQECEDGNIWAISKTFDIGPYQIHWPTAKEFGAKDLRDVIEPYRATELAAKIIKKKGVKAWVQRQCIMKKLIYNKKGRQEIKK